MRPLLFFGVIYVFFTKIVNISKGIPHYGVYLLTGIVLWNYLAEATGGCVSLPGAARERCCGRSASRGWSCRCRCR